MAQPKNTVYIIMAESYNGQISPLAYDDGLAIGCGRGYTLGKDIKDVSFNEATLQYGYKKAKFRLYSIRRRTKETLQKGNRPRFFLRKMQLKELKRHNDWPLIKNSLWAKNNGYAN